MKFRAFILLCLCLCFAFAGCEADENGTAAIKEETGEAPAVEKAEETKKGYIGSLVRAPASAKERTAVVNLQNQLTQYKAVHGQWPGSLDELQQWTGGPLPQLPDGSKYHYEPKSGKVEIRKEGAEE